MKGSSSDFSKEFINISFVPCARSESLECASETEVKSYLADKTFVLMGLTNYIKMKEVVPLDETLKKTRNFLLFTKVDLEKPYSK